MASRPTLSIGSVTQMGSLPHYAIGLLLPLHIRQILFISTPDLIHKCGGVSGPEIVARCCDEIFCLPPQTPTNFCLVFHFFQLYFPLFNLLFLSLLPLSFLILKSESRAKRMRGQRVPWTQYTFPPSLPLLAVGLWGADQLYHPLGKSTSKKSSP